MKFYCDKCQTKYSIADEKVRGKVLKIRCKKCTHIITVREAAQPAPGTARSALREQAPAAARGPAAASLAWHYAVNGQSYGPYTFERLSGMFAEAKLGDAVYIWNETFTDWKPVRDVAEFAPALEAARKLAAPQRTLGISQALEAVRVDALEELAGESSEPSFAFDDSDADETILDSVDSIRAQAEAAPAARANEVSPAQHVAKPFESQGDVVAAVARPQESALKHDIKLPSAIGSAAATSPRERLQRLRERLKTDTLSGEASVQSDGEQEEAARAEASAPAAATRMDDVAERADTLAAVEPSGDSAVSAANATDRDAQAAPAESPAARDHDGLFANVDRSEAELEFEFPELAQESSSAEEDQVPFFPSAPNLASSAPAAREEVSGSLLIQLNSISRQGRGKRLALLAGCVVLVAGIVGVGVYINANRVVEPVEAPPRIQQPQSREIVFRRYSKEEHSRMNRLVELNDEVLTREESQAMVQDEATAQARRAMESRVPGKAAPAAQATKSGGAEPALRGIAAPAVPANAFEEAMNAASGQRSGGASSSGLQRDVDGTAALAAADSAGARAGSPDDERFNAFAALQPGAGDAPIYRPKQPTLQDKRQPAGLDSAGLSAEQAQEGFRTVRRSIGLCRERHMRRGVALDVPKIYVTIEVQPSGKVSSYSVEPESIRETEFDRCMVSHMGRWNFAAFGGESVSIRAPFVLQ